MFLTCPSIEGLFLHQKCRSPRETAWSRRAVSSHSLLLVPSQPWANHAITFSRCPQFAQWRITGSFISQALQELHEYLYHLFGSQALFSIGRPSDPQSGWPALGDTGAQCQRALNPDCCLRAWAQPLPLSLKSINSRHYFQFRQYGKSHTKYIHTFMKKEKRFSSAPLLQLHAYHTHPLGHQGIIKVLSRVKVLSIFFPIDYIVPWNPG